MSDATIDVENGVEIGSIDSPTHCTGIESLPNEILVMIAESLTSGSDLASLVRVSKRFLEVAQDALYADIHIPDTKFVDKKRVQRNFVALRYRGGYREPRRSRVTNLFSTLSKKPYLALKVRDLSIWPGLEDALFQLETLCYSSVTLPMSKGINVKISESLILGMLLTKLPNLRHLSIGIEDIQTAYAGSTVKDDLLPLLFGDETPSDPTTSEITSIPGLAKLESLDIDTGRISFSWCILPNLRQLEVGSKAYLCSPADDKNQTSPLEWLSLSGSARDFDAEPSWDGEEWYNRHKRAICCFQELKTLCIVLSKNGFGGMDWSHISDFEDGVRNHLESLELSEGEQPNWPYYVYPISSLVSFTSLRTLVLQQNALLGSDYDESIQTPDDLRQNLPVEQLLPPYIVELVISFPDIRVLTWLKELCAARCIGALTHMSKIHFHCSDSFKDDYRSFSTALQGSRILADLKDSGLSIWTHCVDTNASQQL